MIRMEATDDAMFADMSWKENGVGSIDIETMVYNGAGGAARFSRGIRVNDKLNHPEATGWGEKIFEGTLGELIEKLQAREDTPDKLIGAIDDIQNPYGADYPGVDLQLLARQEAARQAYSEGLEAAKTAIVNSTYQKEEIK